MSPSFNLVDQPWLRVINMEGAVSEVSLIEFFECASSFRDLAGELVSQDFAVLRFLLAVVHRAMEGPKDVDTLEEFWEDPSRLSRAAVSYLERHRDRLDARHPVNPFYQVAELRTAGDSVSGLEKIIADVPSGQPFFTTRMNEGVDRISWAEAVRWLIHVHAFDPAGIRSGAVGDPRVKGGKGYPIGPGWAGQIGGVYLRGENLLETLLLNTVVPGFGNGLNRVAAGSDLPPWEREQLTACEEVHGGRSFTGPVDCYTWQSRRVRLVGDCEVTGVVLAQGDRAVPQNRQNVEPLSGWRFSEPQTRKFKVPTYMPRKHQPSRAFWRGLTSTIAQNDPGTVGLRKDGQQAYLIPPVIASYEYLVLEGIVPLRPLLPICAVGLEYGSNESVIVEVVHDEISVPEALWRPERDEAVVMVRDMVERTDAVSRTLQNLASNIARACGVDDTSALRARTAEDFYHRVDPYFRKWLVTVAGDSNETRGHWLAILQVLAAATGRTLIEAASPSAYAGRIHMSRRVDVGQAEAWFWAQLRELLPPRPDSNKPRNLETVDGMEYV